MTGFGRTGRWFAIEHSGVVPDMLLVAKGLTAGYMPLAATIVTDEIFRTVRALDVPGPEFASGNTWDAHPPSCAAALAVLDALERDDLVGRVAGLADRFAAEVGRVREVPIVGDVRAIGLVAGIELVRDRATRELFPPETARGGALRRALLAAARDRPAARERRGRDRAAVHDRRRRAVVRRRGPGRRRPRDAGGACDMHPRPMTPREAR